jgi:hypothetical protein
VYVHVSFSPQQQQQQQQAAQASNAQQQEIAIPNNDRITGEKKIKLTVGP